MCWKNINHRLKWWEYVTQTLEGWTTRCFRVGVWSKSILPWKLVIFKWLMMKIWTMRYLSNLKRHIWSEEFKSKSKTFLSWFKIPKQLNEHETIPYFLQLSQNLTSDCLLISVYLPVFAWCDDEIVLFWSAEQFYDHIQKTVKTGKNTEINKQSNVKFWLNWMKYVAV